MRRLAAALSSLCLALAPLAAAASPRVIVISLDGAKPDLVERFLLTGALDDDTGIGRIAKQGTRALQNVTVTPSVTAVAHLAIATGSTAVHDDIPANTFHPVAAAITASLSGFAAPIGGYQLSPLGPSPAPTAEPLWVRLRAAGLRVTTATWPGSDGADISVAGTLVQPAVPTRTNDLTVPFGAFGGLGARGFVLGAASFVAADGALVAQLAAVGLDSESPVQVTAAPIETVFCAPAPPVTCGTTNGSGRSLQYDFMVAALDRKADGTAAYDTLVVFDRTSGVPAGPFAPPSTGAAVAALGGPSGPFYLEGSGARVGTGFFTSALAPDLSSVHLVRYGANFIPRNAPVLDVVDDVNTHVGFWAPQADFRIPERISPGFTEFSDEELEAAYRDQVATFVDYQTRVALRALERDPDADLAMIYIEQPDGSGHQFTLTDLRQPTNPLDPTSIGLPGFPRGATGQDPKKVLRYAGNVRFAYQQASRAVERIVQAAGIDAHGRPRSDVFVVSDHGMAPFHTAVSLANLLKGAGVDLAKVGIRTTGPAGHVYVNLAGRESGGTVTPDEYPALVAQIAAALRGAVDPNAVYNRRGDKLFSDVFVRPGDCGRPGFCTNDDVGQDSGDVMGLMIEGYNFDGIQAPGVARLGDPAFDAATTVYSLPNFYGAHGHNSELRSMSAILYAAGPHVKAGRILPRVRNIDVAPTVLEILGVAPAPTVDGRVIPGLLNRR